MFIFLGGNLGSNRKEFKDEFAWWFSVGIVFACTSLSSMFNPSGSNHLLRMVSWNLNTMRFISVIRHPFIIL